VLGFYPYTHNSGGNQPMRKRLSYANVTATLALVFAMSGGALAANHYLITSTKQISPKVLKKLKGNTGANGTNGANGATGATGAQGPAGKEGTPGKEGSPGKDATFHTLTWTALTLKNGWAPYPGSFYGGTPSFTKDGEGFVHLTGSLSGAGNTSELAAVLPEGFRPPKGAWVAVGNSNGAFNPYSVNVFITPAGELEVVAGEKANDSFVSLEGVEFYVG
jgi:Collagen triple helix repeat (20 copies)